MQQTEMNFDIGKAYSKPTFGGESYEPTKDKERLMSQVDKVRELMSDGVARTLYEISAKCGCSEASSSARLRDLRKAQFGSHVIDRTRDGNTFFYRMVKK